MSAIQAIRQFVVIIHIETVVHICWRFVALIHVMTVMQRIHATHIVVATVAVTRAIAKMIIHIVVVVM